MSCTTKEGGRRVYGPPHFIAIRFDLQCNTCKAYEQKKGGSASYQTRPTPSFVPASRAAAIQPSYRTVLLPDTLPFFSPAAV